MPTIPGLPAVEPVARPSMSPAQAGIPGATIASLGQDIQGMASAQMAVEAHIIAAQRQLELKQGELAIAKHAEQTEEDLGKTSTTEQADAVYEHAQQEGVKILEPYSKDPRVAHALDMYRQHVDLSLKQTTNVRKTHIIANQTKATDSLKLEASTQDWITAQRSGADKETLARIEGGVATQLQNSVAVGVKTQPEVDVEMHNWRHDAQKGVAVAAMYSPDAAERKRTIEQLKTGKGSLDLSMLNDEEKGLLYDHAVKANNSLTNDENNKNTNSVLNAMHAAFQSPEYTATSAKLKALGDATFNKSIGNVTADGLPDWERAKEMRAYVMADHATEQVAMEEQADKVINSVSEAVTKGNYSKAYGLVRQNINTIQAPEKYKGLAERMVGSIRSAANRVDEDISPKTNAITFTKWLHRIDAGEDINDPAVRAELQGDPHLKAESIVGIDRYARAHEDTVVRGGLALATERIKKNFPTSQKALEDAFVQGKLKPEKGQKLEDAMSQFEQLQLDAYSNAREDLAAWVSQQQELAAAGKRPSLTQDEILKAGEDIANHRTPPIVKQLDALHADRQKMKPAPSHGDKPPVMEQYSESRKLYRYSTDGGTTWQQGRAPSQR